jgi:hypothetical protein
MYAPVPLTEVFRSLLASTARKPPEFPACGFGHGILHAGDLVGAQLPDRHAFREASSDESTAGAALEPPLAIEALQHRLLFGGDLEAATGRLDERRASTRLRLSMRPCAPADSPPRVRPPLAGEAPVPPVAPATSSRPERRAVSLPLTVSVRIGTPRRVR